MDGEKVNFKETDDLPNIISLRKHSSKVIEFTNRVHELTLISKKLVSIFINHLYNTSYYHIFLVNWISNIELSFRKVQN